MEEKIYTLSEIPMTKPSIIFNALKFVDQRQLLSLVGEQVPYARASLLPIVSLAIKSRAVRMAKATVPTKGVFEFVDLQTFPDEFNEFIRQIGKHETAVNSTDLSRLLDRNQVKRNTFKQKILRSVTGNKQLFALYAAANRWLLPIIEPFYATPERLVQLAANSLFRPSQIREEIVGLMKLLAEKRPSSILEIGTNRGGTLYLFARTADPAAKLTSMDLQLQTPRLITSFARKKQQITLIEADSTAPATVQQVKKLFPDGLDFLFLDGDHSYEGVKIDFQNYAPLVKAGGLIAFHDIIEDNETRYGVVTGGWSGGVPRFWQEIKQTYKHIEFVKDYAQDGLGIGVLFMPETGLPHA